MNILLLVLVLWGTPPENGSLIFLKDNSIITGQILGNSVTHSAIIFYDGKQPYVYEVMPKVTRRPLQEYIDRFFKPHSLMYRNKAQICIANPKIPYTTAEIMAMRKYADAQMGRHFSLKGFTHSHPVEGIHCSEYVTYVLIASGRMWSKNPGRVSPESLCKSIVLDYRFSKWFTKGDKKLFENYVTMVMNDKSTH